MRVLTRGDRLTAHKMLLIGWAHASGPFALPNSLRSDCHCLCSSASSNNAPRLGSSVSGDTHSGSHICHLLSVLSEVTSMFVHEYQFITDGTYCAITCLPAQDMVVGGASCK